MFVGTMVRVPLSYISHDCTARLAETCTARHSYRDGLADQKADTRDSLITDLMRVVLIGDPVHATSCLPVRATRPPVRPPNRRAQTKADCRAHVDDPNRARVSRYVNGAGTSPGPVQIHRRPRSRSTFGPALPDTAPTVVLMIDPYGRTHTERCYCLQRGGRPVIGAVVYPECVFRGTDSCHLHWTTSMHCIDYDVKWAADQIQIQI